MPMTLASSPPQAVTDYLTLNTDYQAGSMAMEDQLYLTAATKFRLVLQSTDIPSEVIPYVQIALVESLIRSSNAPQGDSQLALEALELLNEEAISDQPYASIWKAEAFFALGRYQDAVTALAEVPATNEKYSETQLSRARILLALGQTTEALELLIKLGQSGSTQVKNAANLLTTEIHINLGNYDIATNSIEKIDGQVPAAAKVKEYLAARLALSSKENSYEAIERFQSLLAAPDHLSEPIFHACMLGKADAQAAANQPEDATATLEQFIDNYPNSMMLPAAFDRLASMLLNNQDDNSAIISKLKQWSGDLPPGNNPLYRSGESNSAISPFQPHSHSNNDLISLALYHRAALLAQNDEPKNNQLAMALLARLRAQHIASQSLPSELYLKLSSASLIDTAYLHLKQNNTSQATFTLSVMEKTASSPRLRDEASFLRGLLLADQNESSEALNAFEYARQ
ncbi:MAG: tetratricopeptide repeat protein, partial [Akkermansiaceae bacterium]